MQPKIEKTPADFIVIALSPLLIMALVGSLVFFLVEVLYVGQYQGNLLWILFFYVFGAVLVARISIELDGARASMYGLILGGATFLGMLRYVEYPPGTGAAEFGWAINLGLLGIIWWSTHRLTWDCTMIDDTQDASGAGLLQAAGLEDDPQPGPDSAGEEKEPKRRKRKDTDLQAWWERYRRYREERRRQPHVPGVWVVYFSLAALPLYGLGQALIPPGEEERRRYAFWLMSTYVGSGLGLLLTTSFLGLRRYLRQKNVRMPVGITGVWLFLGAALIVVFLVLGALLPRPAAEYALIDLPWRAGSAERNASRFAKQGDEPGKDDGRAGTQGKDEKDGGGKEKSSRKDQGGKDKEGSAASSKSDKASSSGADGKDKSAEKDAPKDKRSSEAKKSGAGDKSQPKKEDNAKGDGKAAPDQKGQAEPNASAPTPSAWIGKLAAILKWIVIGAFVLVVAFVLLRAGLKFLANFTGWAKGLLDFFRSLWQRLAGGRDAKEGAKGGGSENAKPLPFRTFRDPFLTGAADRMSAAELVRYTFEALEAWAIERDLPRQAGDTPLEFAERLAEESPELAEDVRQLARYYAGLAYARQTLKDDCRDPLRQLWLTLAETGASREQRDRVGEAT